MLMNIISESPFISLDNLRQSGCNRAVAWGGRPFLPSQVPNQPTGVALCEGARLCEGLSEQLHLSFFG
jgi:hypothetical protein